MAAIGASDVSYAVSFRKKKESSQVEQVVAISFGDGVKTYPAGGIPLTKGQMGCPNVIVSAEMVDAGSADGFIYKYDLANNKIRIYQGDNTNVAAAPAVELGAVAVAASSVKMLVAGY